MSLMDFGGFIDCSGFRWIFVVLMDFGCFDGL